MRKKRARLRGFARSFVAPILLVDARNCKVLSLIAGLFLSAVGHEINRQRLKQGRSELPFFAKFTGACRIASGITHLDKASIINSY